MENGLNSQSCKIHYDFNADHGKKNLIKFFSNQCLFKNISLKNFEKFLPIIQIKEYADGEIIYTQGEYDKHSLYFVLSGSCYLFINKNFLRELGKGECFGEFPILSAEMIYYATVKSAQNQTCIATISEEEFRKIAKGAPKVWENMAEMVAQRLKNSGESRFRKQPNYKPKIFIASSSEKLNEANTISSLLKDNYVTVIWNQNFFGLTDNTLEKLEKDFATFDYGIFIFAPDDKIESRGKTQFITRDNVIFELGMFMGKHSIEKAFIVYSKESDIHILSDYNGRTSAIYDPSSSESLSEALAGVCAQIRLAIDSSWKKIPRL